MKIHRQKGWSPIDIKIIVCWITSKLLVFEDETSNVFFLLCELINLIVACWTNMTFLRKSNLKSSSITKDNKNSLNTQSFILVVAKTYMRNRKFETSLFNPIILT